MRPHDNGLLAAVDLGSNSFHLLLAARRGAAVETVLHRRDSVRLAAGVGADGRLDEAYRAAALATLRGYGALVRDVAPGCVAAAATAAVRNLADPIGFLRDAGHALGHPVELVTGEEEARLIWLGAEHMLPPHSASRLVIDIGGASTEFIVGAGAQPEHVHSAEMGCVVTPRELWPDGVLNADAWQHAHARLLEALRPIAAPFQAIGWQDAWAGAGAAATIGGMAAADGFAADSVDAVTLHALAARLQDGGRVDRVDLPGLDADHARIAPGGLLVMSAIVEAFDIQHLQLREFAMRDGLLQSLLPSLTMASVSGQPGP